MSLARLAVFAGPSLPPSDRPVVPGIAYLRSAARGDVERAASEYDALLLIDGVFHHDLAPSPLEVRRACRRVVFLGAASMGALRAVECRPYGAVPLGAIAAWYAAEVIDGDDEVAVLIDRATHRALTVPSVNVRYVARLAERRGLLDREQADRWVRRARTEIYYAERSWRNAIALAPAGAQARLAEIARNEGDLKRLDARFALRRAIRLLDVSSTTVVA